MIKYRFLATFVVVNLGGTFMERFFRQTNFRMQKSSM